MIVKLGAWNIRGLSKITRQDEMKKFIREEGLSMCVVVETRLRKKFVKQAGDNVFDKWSWVSNIGDCRSVCRIMVGWDSDVIGANLISHCDQVMHFEINFVHDHRKQYVSFVYAKNFDGERKIYGRIWLSTISLSRVSRGLFG